MGNDYLVYAETQYLWPPPLLDLYNRDSEYDASTASSLWVAKGAWTAEIVQELLGGLHQVLGQQACIAAFQLCKYLMSFK